MNKTKIRIKQSLRPNQIFKPKKGKGSYDRTKEKSIS